MVKKKMILKIMQTTIWVALGCGVIVLLVAAIHKEDKQKCTGLNVVIKGVSNNFFVDKNDILTALNQYVDGSPVGKSVSLFNLENLENDLQKNIWVKQAQIFFDNNAALQVIVTEREPVARVFTSTGTTFYIDSACSMLPLSEKYSARLPVFTNFPSDKTVLTKADSTLLKDISIISIAIQKNPFWMAMIEQIDISMNRTFELIPKIGNSIITFGDAANTIEKLNRLLLFYKQVLVKCGWDYYSAISVQYTNQVVAKRKGAEDKTTDSLRTLQMMQMIAYNAEHLANDSLQTIVQDNENNTTDFSLIQQSIQRDDNGEPAETTNPQGIPVNAKAVLSNPVPMKNSLLNVKPKAPVKKTGMVVMPAKKASLPKPTPLLKQPLAENKKVFIAPVSAKQQKPIQAPLKPAAKKTKPALPKPNNEY